MSNMRQRQDPIFWTLMVACIFLLLAMMCTKCAFISKEVRYYNPKTETCDKSQFDCRDINQIK